MHSSLIYHWHIVVFSTALAGMAAAQSADDGSAALARARQAATAFNPEVSAVIDVFFHASDGHEDIAHIKQEILGFGHAHGPGDSHGHQGHGVEPGFNLRHLELAFGAVVDPYFRALAIAAIDLHGAEIEVAEIETTGLPAGLKLKLGKFYSDFGHINAQHAHQWDFTDRPLIYELTLGDHGLNETGAQLSWLAPAPFFLMAGAEVFQGRNELMFDAIGDEPLRERDGPRLVVGWLKAGPDWSGPHALQFGVSAGSGRHQEAHDGSGDGAHDHWLDGDSTFYGADFVYKYSAQRTYGEGNLTVQGEYFRRKKDLHLIAHERRPEFVGNSRVDDQDGYYLQAVYGIAPRWRAGARWEQVGLTNTSDLPSGASESFGTSDRASVMVDFTPTESSRIRLQANRGSYATDEGREGVWEAMLQFVVLLGSRETCQFCASCVSR